MRIHRRERVREQRIGVSEALDDVKIARILADDLVDTQRASSILLGRDRRVLLRPFTVAHDRETRAGRPWCRRHEFHGFWRTIARL